MITRSIIAFVLLASCAIAQGFPRTPNIPKELRPLIPKTDEHEDKKPSAPHSKPDETSQPEESSKQEQNIKQTDQRPQPETPKANPEQSSAPEKQPVSAYRTLNFGDEPHVITDKLVEIVAGGTVSRKSFDPSRIIYKTSRDALLDLNTEHEPIQTTSGGSKITDSYFARRLMNYGIDVREGVSAAIEIYCFAIDNRFTLEDQLTQKQKLAIVHVKFKRADLQEILTRFKEQYPEAKTIKRQEDHPRLSAFSSRETTTQIVFDTPAKRMVLTLPDTSIEVKSNGTGSLGDFLPAWQRSTREYNSKNNKNVSTDEFMEIYAREVTVTLQKNESLPENSAISIVRRLDGINEKRAFDNDERFPTLTVSSNEILTPIRKALAAHVQNQELAEIEARRKKTAAEKDALNF